MIIKRYAMYRPHLVICKKKKPLCFGETFAWGWAATLKAAAVCLMCSHPGSMSPLARRVTGLTEAN